MSTSSTVIPILTAWWVWAYYYKKHIIEYKIKYTPFLPPEIASIWSLIFPVPADMKYYGKFIIVLNLEAGQGFERNNQIM